MSYRSPKGYVGWSQLGILFGMVGVGLILAAILQAVIGFMATDHRLDVMEQLKTMGDVLLKPENSIYLQLSQAAGTFCMFFLASVWYSRICYGKEKLWLGFSSRFNIWQVVIGCAVMFCANAGSSVFADLTKNVLHHYPSMNAWALELENSYNKAALAMSSIKSTWAAFFLALIIMAVLAGLFEEILFRGALQNLLVRWLKHPIWAIIITSLLFSFIHGTVYSFISRAILGFVLGWMYYRSKNIWVNIMAHFFNNAVVVIGWFIMARRGQKLGMADVEEDMPLAAGIFFLVVLVGLMILFEKVSAKKRAAIEADEQQLWAAAEARNKDNWNNY